MTDDQLALPGLEPVDPPSTSSRPSDLEVAARRSLQALAAERLLEERHALTCQLVLDLARVVSSSTRAGKASAAAMAAAQLREAWDTLPTPSEDAGDAWAELAADLRDAARGIVRDRAAES